MTEKFTCIFCGASFSKEKTLAVHNCSMKRRIEQKNEQGTRFGYELWVKFLRSSSMINNTTYEDFIKSSLFTSFVKVGNVMVQWRVIDAKAFIDYAVKSGVPINKWTSDKFYDEFIIKFIREEWPGKALERTFKFLQSWADSNNCHFSMYFKASHPLKIYNDVKEGYISPWVLYNSDSGQQFLSALLEEQIDGIIQLIDPVHWERKFETYQADVQLIKEACQLGGM